MEGLADLIDVLTRPPPGELLPTVSRACGGDLFREWFYCRINLYDWEWFLQLCFYISQASTITLLYLVIYMMYRPTVPIRTFMIVWFVSIVLADHYYPFPLIRWLFGFIHEFFTRTASETFSLMFQIVATLILIGALLIWPSFRNRDRIVVAITSSAVFITFIHFHYLFLNAGLMANLQDSQARAEIIASSSPEEFAWACQAMRLYCREMPPDQGLTSADLDLSEADFIHGHEAFLSRQIDGWLTIRAENLYFDPGFFAFFLNGNFDNGGPYVVVYRETETARRLILDRTWTVTPFEVARVTMKVQMGLAHLIWFMGGMLVIWSHRRMARLRAARARATPTNPGIEAALPVPAAGG